MLKFSIELVGWLAAALMLSAYVLLTTGHLSSRSSMYHWLNVLSGAGFVINSGWNGALPSAFINVVWAGIGIGGLIAHSRLSSRSQPESL